MQTFRKGIEAGVLIVIGCTVFLACKNPYVGALMFSVALCSICNLNMSLYTGRICFIKSIREIKSLLICVYGNCVGCFIAAMSIRIALPNISALASDLCSAKLSREPLSVFILAVFCGVLMAVAVRTFKRYDGAGKYTGIFTCIPAFILCGFEHSIADIGYFLLAFPTPLKDTLIFLLCVLAGNTVGGLILTERGDCECTESVNLRK